MRRLIGLIWCALAHPKMDWHPCVWTCLPGGYVSRVIEEGECPTCKRKTWRVRR